MEKLKYISTAVNRVNTDRHCTLGLESSCTSLQGNTGLLSVTEEHISEEERNTRGPVVPHSGPWDLHLRNSKICFDKAPRTWTQSALQNLPAILKTNIFQFLT